MLVGLDEIEWSKLSHAYGSAENIPDMLREMDESTPNEFLDIFNDFMNDVYHQQTLYEVTPYTIPFLAQIMKTSSSTDVKTHCLWLLADLAETETNGVSSRSHITDARLRLQLYDALENVSDQLFALASHKDVRVKLLSLYIISYLRGIRLPASLALKQGLESSDDVYLQMVAIWGYTCVLDDNPEYYTHKSELQQLLEWAESDRDFLVRATAAVSYLKLSDYGTLYIRKHKPLPATIIDLMIRIFEVDILALTQEASKRQEMFEALSNNFLHLTPFNDYDHFIPDHPALWLLIVQRGAMTPKNAFACVKRLLDHAFHTKYVKEKNDPSQQSIFYETSQTGESGFIIPVGHDKGITHIFRPGPFPHTSDQPLTAIQRDALEAVVRCDSFWQIRTNLLSFFYGLPDDREQLRALLNAS